MSEYFTFDAREILSVTLILFAIIDIVGTIPGYHRATA